MWELTVEGKDRERILDHAAKAWINGKSHIRGADREECGPEDQIVGQLGEYALATFLGSPEDYFTRRERVDLTPHLGDGGSDFNGLPIDVKTSLMRRSQDPTRYNLLVRPHERHDGNRYVLALVNQSLDRVTLVGWLEDESLPEMPERSGIFTGAFRTPATSLHGMTSISR